jgi:hypothetical protein
MGQLHPAGKGISSTQKLDLGSADTKLTQAGEVIFEEFGGAPGNSYTWVKLKDDLTISLLQARLIELGLPICKGRRRTGVFCLITRWRNDSGEARRLAPLSLNHVRVLSANDRFALSSRADDDSLCARVAFAGCSGRSHNVQNAYRVGAVGAEQYLCGLAHRFALLDVDPDIQ